MTQFRKLPYPNNESSWFRGLTAQTKPKQFASTKEFTALKFLAYAITIHTAPTSFFLWDHDTSTLHFIKSFVGALYPFIPHAPLLMLPCTSGEIWWTSDPYLASSITFDTISTAEKSFLFNMKAFYSSQVPTKSKWKYYLSPQEPLHFFLDKNIYTIKKDHSKNLLKKSCSTYSFLTNL